MAKEYTQVCVYTILHSDKLAAICQSNGQGRFTERRKWKTAATILRQATANEQIVPVIFAPAEDTRKLVYFAELVALRTTQKGDREWSTTVSIRNLTAFPAPQPLKTRLVVESKRENLSPNHIRPYVLVQTPSFLSKVKPKETSSKSK